MEWTLITVMAWVTSVSAVRYADYTGAKMPQYGSNEYETVRDPERVGIVGEDYHGHSPDASSSFDYKYEDERSGKSEKQIEESDNTVNWNMPARKHREILRPPDENNLEIIDKYVPETETATKFKANRRFLKHRSRLKSKHFHEDEETSSRWSVKNIRVKKFDSDITKRKFDVHGNEIRDDTWGELDIDNEHYRPLEITERVIRRKPRDRSFNRIHSNVEAPNDDIQLDRKMKSERRLKVDYIPEDEDRNRQRMPYRPFSDEEEDQEPKEPGRPKLKGYEEYGDYYDMKRVHNIKSKLPMLVRRPTAGMETTVAASSDVIAIQWTYRRKNLPVSIPQESSSTLSTSSSISTSTTLKLIHTDEVPNRAHEELSLAEKSKLSIMKKAQRKENMHMGKLSTKPPVLLQVTKKMLTVVVVEPPTSAAPWMRANVLVDDTPERMERAKKLMRNKLVARARNIQDLTDNWDEMICDYIDVSMLDGVTQTSQNYAVFVTEIFLLFLVH